MTTQVILSVLPMLVAVSLLIATAFLVLRLKKERTLYRFEIRRASDLREGVNLKLQSEAGENARLLNEIARLESEISALDTRSDRLNRRIAAQEAFLESRNDQIGQIIISLKKHNEVKENRILSRQIRELMALMKSQEHWGNFLGHFEHVNNQMLSRLWKKHPNLVQNDVRYLSYVYMNLSPKEISSLLNISHEASRKRQERIRAKLGLDPSVSLMEYLTAF